MGFLVNRRSGLQKYAVLVGICILFQAFVMRPSPVKETPLYNHAAYKGELLKYFEPPQLPEEFCNAIPKKVEPKKSKRINARTKAIIVPLNMNPVLGATRKSIISFFGDARDNGRSHEGIDIVAPKGTYVVAPADGEIVQVNYNSLGGKVIWMKDAKHKRAYYFAHLDSQMVSKGMIVKPGDTLGTVGNTGNARRTRSHLHFGVYKANGKAPVEYIKTREQVLTLLSAAE